MTGLVDTLKTVAKAGWSYQYNRSNARWVARILKQQEEAGIRTDEKTKHVCEEYARDVLGGKKYAPRLTLYATVRGEFKEGWIPDHSTANGWSARPAAPTARSRTRGR